ncbi:putative U6 snRNA associated protein [Blattamonas nauphoetae]|uniref:U6 snRNA associated protein n=1 Tax=Blattamonas nauphoetae TaxID=2049346 RepID=A0ABQ9YFQ5_9EUKA|nr:putative U6 snRNA associated protein [Blattamonas nauphoetae]
MTEISKKPGEFTRSLVGHPVKVKLTSNIEYRGILISLDGHLNVVLEDTEEYVGGSLKNKLGDTFIRGNNLLYISPMTRKK